MKNSILLIISIFLLNSCEKKEKPITLPAKGDGQVMQVDMGVEYDFQYFVSLQDQKIVHISKVDIWDLAFESGPNQHAIFLNGGKGMAAYNTGKSKFNEVSYSDTIQAKQSWAYDSPTGITDSAALGDWKSKNLIYIIRLNESGTKIRKLQILSEDPFQYTIAVGDISSIFPVTMNIIKKQDCNFTYFAFDKLATIDNVEPAKNTWDLQFTRYNYSFYDQNPVLRYVVTGVLLNPTSTSAYKDSLTEYNNIKEEFSNSVPLSTNRDVIGYDWKLFNSASNNFSIIKKYNYIIKNQNNHYFKLHFLDFYSSTGVKGSPKFEYYQLK